MRISKFIKASLLALPLFLSENLFASKEKPIYKLIDRVLGKGASRQFVLELEDKQSNKPEYFTISQKGNKPFVKANSLSALSRGLNWYLSQDAQINITWNQLHAKLPKQLSVPKKERTHQSSVPLRYYLNYCTYSYSMAFWDWKRWEEELDLMALQGINMPLLLTGMEHVWQNILLDMGYSQEEVNKFVAGPAFQAWWLMNNLEGWGNPAPKWWYQNRAELAKRVVSRMRELGMEPVLPGYSGMVPHNIKQRLGWEVADPGLWCQFQRPGFLLPTDKHFEQIASLYYMHLTELYGTSRYYSMDPFHEGGDTKGVNIPKAYQATYQAMLKANPKAQWVIQSWNENPRPEALSAIPKGGLIVLDLFSDGTPKWQNYQGHKFVYCMLHNFGGRTGLHGRLAKTMNGYYEALSSKPNELLGIGATPEGIETNPVLYDLLYSLPWDSSLTPVTWLRAYVQSRYAKDTNEKLQQAWVYLLNSAYNCSTPQQGTSEAVYLARPSLNVKSVSTWSTSKISYNTDDVVKALQLVIEGMPKSVSENRHYSYDLIEVLRQVLADKAYHLLPEIKTAYETKEYDKFRRLYNQFLEIILDTDRLLASHESFRLGNWLSSARALGRDTQSREWLEWNARLLVTTWGERASTNEGGLKDYSNRAWAGLLKDYYYPRWVAFFEHLDKGKPLPDWYDMEYQWVNNRKLSYRRAPEGDTKAIAIALCKKYQLL